MRLSVDSNILIYAVDRNDPPRHQLAANLMARLQECDAVLTAQAVAEFLNVIHRKQPALLEDAVEEVRRWTSLFPIVPTGPGHVLAASTMAVRHRLQCWDCVIWQAAASAQVECLFSEDLQHGFALDGMRVLNPFALDLAELAALLI